MGALVTTLPRNVTTLGANHRKSGILALRYVTTLAAIVTLSACTTTRGSFCDISRPIRLSEQSIANLTDAEVQDVLSFNEKGRALCGWKP